jgi:hypothetical protein
MMTALQESLRRIRRPRTLRLHLRPDIRCRTSARLAISAATASMVLFGGGVAPAAPQPVSLLVEDTTVAFPGFLVMKGRASGTSGWVEIQAKKCGERSFSSFTSAEIDRGQWEVRAPGKTIQENAVIRAVWRRERSASVRIRVEPGLWMLSAEAEGRLGVPLPREREGMYDVAMQLSSYYPGGKVFVQRLDRAANAWRTFRMLRLKRGTHGISYVFFRPAVPRGTPMRAVRPASRDGCYVKGISRVVVTK